MIKTSDLNPPAANDGLGENLSQNTYIRTGPRGQSTAFANPATG